MPDFPPFDDNPFAPYDESPLALRPYSPEPDLLSEFRQANNEVLGRTITEQEAQRRREALIALCEVSGEYAAAEAIKSGARGTIELNASLGDTRDGREDAIKWLQDAFDDAPSVIIIHGKHETVDVVEIPCIDGDDDNEHMPAILRDAFGISMSEGRRLLAQEAVKVNGEVHRDLEIRVRDLHDSIVQVGKRRKARIRLEWPHA